jgi:glycosyltransferase involved in cell wall biosynthesis
VKIGLYSSTLPEPDRKPGGVDVYVDRLAEQLVARGHQVVVFTYSQPPLGRRYEVRPVTPRSLVESRLRRMLIAPARLNALDTDELDVLHLHGDDWFYLRRSVPTVRTLYGSALYEARHATSAARAVSQYATYGLELLSAHLATKAFGLIPNDGPGYRTAGHLPLSVDLPEAYRLDRSGPPTVLFVGTWAGRKRGSLLQRAFTEQTLPRVPSARLVMVSDRCEPAAGVDWAARPSDAELLQLYRAAWILCLPSSYEGFGLPYLEAMAEGTAAVATSNPGAQFVLAGGRYGSIVADEELGAELARLLLDETAREQLAQAGRRRAEQFGWEEGLTRHERAYRDAIDAFRASPLRPGSLLRVRRRTPQR